MRHPQHLALSDISVTLAELLEETAMRSHGSKRWHDSCGRPVPLMAPAKDWLQIGRLKLSQYAVPATWTWVTHTPGLLRSRSGGSASSPLSPCAGQVWGCRLVGVCHGSRRLTVAGGCRRSRTRGG
jgi:hypothetical protein